MLSCKGLLDIKVKVLSTQTQHNIDLSIERKRERETEGREGGTGLIGYYILCKIIYIIESLLLN